MEKEIWKDIPGYEAEIAVNESDVVVIISEGI